MSQHDYVIANGTGAAVRSDLNNALAAIVSNNSGATEPTTTHAYMWWPDTTTNTLKLRNGANNAWITLRQLDGDFTTVSVDNGSNSAPSIYFNASGTDTGIYSSGTDAVDIATAGTRRLGVASDGDITFYGGNVTLNAQGDLRFADSDSSNWVAFQSPATVASNVTWTLPSADGTTGQVLSTNGSGTLSWATPTPTIDKISEGNTEAEVVDTGADGHFKVTTEGTERLRVDPSGRLLIGTSSARANFFNSTSTSLSQIEGTGGGSGRSMASIINNSASNDPPWFLIGLSKGASIGSNTLVSNNDDLGYIGFVGNDGSEFVTAASIGCQVDGTPGANDMPGRLVFSTTPDSGSSPVERLRIRADGGVSSYAPSGTTWDLRWNGDTDQVRSIQIIGGASGILSGGTERLRIWNNGDAQNRAGVWGSLSDAKLKTNITDAASQWDDIKSLRVRKYNLLDDLEHAHIGVIAQELELTSPGLVTSHPDLDESGCETGEYTKAVKNSILYMKAVKALQEAMERIEQLEQRLTDAGIA